MLRCMRSTNPAMAQLEQVSWLLPPTHSLEGIFTSGNGAQDGYMLHTGQGYVWLAHREVGSPAWDLAVWSKQLWRDLLAEGLSASLEWQVSK